MQVAGVGDSQAPVRVIAHEIGVDWAGRGGGGGRALADRPKKPRYRG